MRVLLRSDHKEAIEELVCYHIHNTTIQDIDISSIHKNILLHIY